MAVHAIACEVGHGLACACSKNAVCAQDLVFLGKRGVTIP